MNHLDKPLFKLNGKNLTPEILHKLGNKEYYLDLDAESWARVRKSEGVVNQIVKSHEKVYGITTGFGYFSDVLISTQEIFELQKNIIRSHSSGVGKAISIDMVRIMLVLRINVLAKGHSGLRFYKLSLKSPNYFIK